MFILLLLSTVFSFAEDPTYPINPGNMGPLAMPVVRTEDPIVGDQLYVELAWLTNISDSGDLSNAPYFKITVPFKEVVAIEFDGTPIEKWSLSDETHEKWQNPNQSGTSPGDIRFGLRAHIIDEREIVPAIGVRFLVKTTTGKDTEDRRFINAPAYILESLFGKDLLKDEGFLKRVRVLAKLGFMAWQQGNAKQNDAVDYGAGAQFYFDHGINVWLDWSGYIGYQSRDKPSQISVRVTWAHEVIDFYIGGSILMGLGAPDWGATAGIIIHFPIVSPPWVNQQDPK